MCSFLEGPQGLFFVLEKEESARSQLENLVGKTWVMMTRRPNRSLAFVHLRSRRALNDNPVYTRRTHHDAHGNARITECDSHMGTTRGPPHTDRKSNSTAVAIAAISAPSYKACSLLL